MGITIDLTGKWTPDKTKQAAKRTARQAKAAVADAPAVTGGTHDEPEQASVEDAAAK